MRKFFEKSSLKFMLGRVQSAKRYFMSLTSEFGLKKISKVGIGFEKKCLESSEAGRLAGEHLNVSFADKNALFKQVKSGFTLIELMVVLLIIMILTLVTMSGYSGVQRAARIDFAADTLVSVIKEQQVLGRSGQRDSDDDLLCYAVKVEKNGGLKTGVSEYIAAIGGGDDDVVVDECSEVSAWRERGVLGEDVIVDEIMGVMTGASSGDDFEVYFKPPFGYGYYWATGNNFKPLNVIKDGLDGKVEFVLTFAAGSDVSRKVIFDRLTGEVYRVRE
ncbi:prepilin-type N-terminal cleavage/methylation domain-containing protein [Candidatus Peregrinibacteria bacterium]|nr:prepilin-type N-terminal cleavage/methylation domain-containing protein [Candidatus Peregrinibacteria bacterium]